MQFSKASQKSIFILLLVKVFKHSEHDARYIKHIIDIVLSVILIVFCVVLFGVWLYSIGTVNTVYYYSINYYDRSNLLEDNIFGMVDAGISLDGISIGGPGIILGVVSNLKVFDDGSMYRARFEAAPRAKYFWKGKRVSVFEFVVRTAFLENIPKIRLILFGGNDVEKRLKYTRIYVL